MADGRFAITNQSHVKQLKENSKNQNTLKVTLTWLKFCRIGRNRTKSQPENKRVRERRAR